MFSAALKKIPKTYTSLVFFFRRLQCSCVCSIRLLTGLLRYFCPVYARPLTILLIVIIRMQYTNSAGGPINTRFHWKTSLQSVRLHPCEPFDSSSDTCLSTLLFSFGPVSISYFFPQLIKKPTHAETKSRNWDMVAVIPGVSVISLLARNKKSKERMPMAETTIT